MSIPDSAAAPADAGGSPEDSVLGLVHLTADAWRTGLNRHAGLTGFLFILASHSGLETILAEGACAPLAAVAERFPASFPDENEIWQGTASELAARLDRPLTLDDPARLVVHPLYAEGQFSGFIAVSVAEPLPPAVLQEWEVVFIAAATVAALYREHEEQRAQADALRALDAISQSLSRETDTLSLYSVIHREVSRVMECDAFYVCLYDGENRLDYVYRYDQGVYAPPRVQRLGDGPTTYCIRERKPFVLAPDNVVIQQGGTYLGQERRSQSAIHVPMLVDGEPIGVLSAQSYRPGAYQEAHVQLLAIIATKAATAVRNAQLLDHIRSQVDNLRRLTRALQVRDLSLGRVDDLVLTTDVEGNITACNEAVTRTLGLDPSELIGRPIIALRASGRGSWHAFQHARNRRITVAARDGRHIPVLYTTEPLVEDGNVVGYLTIAKDLSDLHRSEEAGRVALALERQRISRDLHDGLIQSLSIAKMQLQILQQADVDEAIQRELADLQDTLSRGLAEARHYIVELKHAHMGHEGLVPTARQYAQELGRVCGLAIGVSADTESSPLSDTDEVQLFYILREALNNVRKHAHAGRVRVEFRVLPSEFRMSVEDDGRGFDPSALPEGSDHWGLQHIRDRARDLGGHAEISSAPGAGTRVSVCVPLPSGGAPDDPREGDEPDGHTIMTEKVAPQREKGASPRQKDTPHARRQP